jgi:type II secretory pathway pseudopilin PulG
MHLISRQVRPKGNRFRRRSAFSLGEVIVAITVMAVVAAMVIPTIKARLSTARGHALAKELSTLATGIQNFQTNVGTYPRFLDMLSSLSLNTQTYCGNDFVPITLTSGQQSNWKGPYVSRTITANYDADGGTIVNKMARDASGNPVFLVISILGVDSDVALVAEETIDGPGANFSSGNFKWDGVDATFRIPAPTTCV